MKFQVKVSKTSKKEKIKAVVGYVILALIIWFFFFK
nr:MAG TPA: hypothetical protein [Caudoviricetes sp.]